MFQQIICTRKSYPRVGRQLCEFSFWMGRCRVFSFVFSPKTAADWEAGSCSNTKQPGASLSDRLRKSLFVWIFGKTILWTTFPYFSHHCDPNNSKEKTLVMKFIIMPRAVIYKIYIHAYVSVAAYRSKCHCKRKSPFARSFVKYLFINSRYGY